MAGDVDGAVLEHVIGPDGIVSLRLSDGDARIVGIAGGTARMRLLTGGRLDHVEIERGERSLSIVVGARFDHELVLEIPAGASLVAEASSSDITAAGLVGVQRYRTSSGDIFLSGVEGGLTVDSMSGDIEIQAQGRTRCELRTVSGDISLRAETLSGVRATTTSGDLRVRGRFVGEDPFAIQSVSGDIQLASLGDVRVEFRTISGQVRSDVASSREQGPGRRSFSIGAAGPTIDVRSTSGDLHLTRPAEPSPASVAGPGEGERVDGGDDRLATLEALERGEIDLAEARRRLDMPAGEATGAGHG
jgi:hypothetical protein